MHALSCVGLKFCDCFTYHNILFFTQNFGKEVLADEKNDLKYDKILKVLETASGAAYGTGK